MLSEEQIQYLYKFCVKHYVRHYDLQVELVDHLAASIENEIHQDPKLSFEEGLSKVYKGFGVMGFSNVITEKQVALAKSYQKDFWRNFLSYFTIPKVALTILTFVLLNIPVFVFKFHDPELLYMIYCLTAALGSIVATIYFSLKYKKPKKQLLLFQNRSMFFGMFGMLLQIPNFYYNFVRNYFVADIHPQTPVNLLMSGFCVVMIILSFAGYESYKKLYRGAKENYPLAFEN